jgi:hypothetical protein
MGYKAEVDGDHIFLGERLGHPRRERKPEFKEGRYPPLDVPSCCALGFCGLLLRAAEGEPQAMRGHNDWVGCRPNQAQER